MFLFFFFNSHVECELDEKLSVSPFALFRIWNIWNNWNARTTFLATNTFLWIRIQTFQMGYFSKILNEKRNLKFSCDSWTYVFSFDRLQEGSIKKWNQKLELSICQQNIAIGSERINTFWASAKYGINTISIITLNKSTFFS